MSRRYLDEQARDITKEDWAAQRERPKTRGDCVGGIRPCPWVGCRWNLFMDVTAAGSIKYRFPGVEHHEMGESCALDVAAEGSHTLDQLGQILQITRERVRQIESNGRIHALHRMGKSRSLELSEQLDDSVGTRDSRDGTSHRLNNRTSPTSR